MSHENHPDEIEEYGDPGIASRNGPIPGWLKFNYVFWPIFGLIWLFMFWNGSYGWFDRGYWQQLQRAASTTFPFQPPEELQEELRKVK